MKTLCALFVASFALGADLPSGASIMQRSIERSGGAEAWAKMKSVEMSGTVNMAGHNITGPVTIFQRGDKSYTVIELPGIGKVEEGFDGETAWEMNALQGPRIKEGAEKAVMERTARLNLLTSWRDYYKEARTAGETDVDGKPAWKVEMTPTDGKPEIFYFDKDSGLLVRIEQTIPSAMGEIAVEVTMGDYRTVSGVKSPFSMTQKGMGQVLSMHFDKVVYNAEIPADRFELPAAVKALKK